MSALEIVVITAGLFLGYWVVSKLFFGGSSATPSSTDSSQERYSGTTVRDEVSSASWNEILEVSPLASADEIKRAYKLLISKYHPDKVAMLGEELIKLAEHKSKEITQAYREALRLRGVDP